HMKSAARSLLVVALLTLPAVGCSLSSMEKKYDDLRGKTDQDTKQVELNTAGRKQLDALPGLNSADADRIVANRPYQRKRALVCKGVLTKAQFDKIKDDVYVDHAKD